MHYLIDFYGFPGWLAIIVSLLMGLAVGWINGFLTVTIGLPSFITTLGTGFVLLGLVNTTSHAEAVPIPPVVTGIGHWIGVRHLVRVHLGRHHRHPGSHPADPDPMGPAHDLGRRQPARRPGSGHQGQADQVRQLHDHRRARRVRRPSGRLPDQHHRPHGRRLHADVLRGHRRGHRRHGHARRSGHGPRRRPRRDRAGHPDRRVQHPRRQRQPAGHHLRRRHPDRHDRQRAAGTSYGKQDGAYDHHHARTRPRPRRRPAATSSASSTSPSATARSPRSTTSTCTWAGARCSACSATTARASPPC